MSDNELKSGAAAAVANRPASYALHIQPLFTTQQQHCMAGYLDLKSFADVKANAQDIYSRLS
jgi:hypothetical protein